MSQESVSQRVRYALKRQITVLPPTEVNLNFLEGAWTPWNMHVYTSPLLSLLHPKIVCELKNNAKVFSGNSSVDVVEDLCCYFASI